MMKSNRLLTITTQSRGQAMSNLPGNMTRPAKCFRTGARRWAEHYQSVGEHMHVIQVVDRSGAPSLYMQRARRPGLDYDGQRQVKGNTAENTGSARQVEYAGGNAIRHLH